MVFHTSIVNWGVEGEYMYPQYMCILPYVKCIWCNGIHIYIVNWSEGVHVSSVYVHSAICDTRFGVMDYSIHLLSIGVGEG